MIKTPIGVSFSGSTVGLHSGSPPWGETGDKNFPKNLRHRKRLQNRALFRLNWVYRAMVRRISNTSPGRHQALKDPLESIQLIEQIRHTKGQDPDILAQAYDRYFVRLMALIRKRMGAQIRTHADEHDIAQSAFGSFVKVVGHGNIDLDDRESLWPLLALIANRKYQDLIARYSTKSRDMNRIASAGTEPIEATLGESEDPLEAAAVNETITLIESRLSDDTQRNVLKLRLEGYSIDEISDQVQLSSRTVKRILQKVRDAWLELEPITE
jgi:RNA polymerase sigma factor (sigma-70 family)